MKYYTTYIWDFDGTLFDSYPHSARALYETMRRYGAEGDLEALRRAMQVNFATAFEMSGLDSEQLRLFHRLRGDDAFSPPIVPFPHAEAVLAALAQKGARHILYTHSNRRMSVRFIERFGLDRYFSGYVTADSPGFVPKPDPGAILYILNKWCADPARAVMVGDREIDMRCARGAGVDGILVDPEHLVGETCAVFRVEDLKEIADEPEGGR